MSPHYGSCGTFPIGGVGEFGGCWFDYGFNIGCLFGEAGRDGPGEGVAVAVSVWGVHKGSNKLGRNTKVFIQMKAKRVSKLTLHVTKRVAAVVVGVGVVCADLDGDGSRGGSMVGVVAGEIGASSLDRDVN